MQKIKIKKKTPDSLEKTCREIMQIVTWPWGKAALNIIKRRQQKKTRRHDMGNVFSLLVSSGRSGMIECWCLPGPLQRRSSTRPPLASQRTRTHVHSFSHTHAHSLSLPVFWVTKTSRRISCHYFTSHSRSFWLTEFPFFKGNILLLFVRVSLRVVFLHGACVRLNYNRV